MLSPRLMRFTRFVLVGALGFGMDAGLLLALTYAGLTPFLARAISISLAVLATFILNRSWTFARNRENSGQNWGRDLLAYGAVAGFTSLVNYAIFALILLIWPGMMPFLALVISSGLAMALSFIGYSGFVFKR